MKHFTKTLSGTAIFAILVIGSLLNACTDTCETTYVYTYYEPVYKTTDEIRDGFEFQEPREIERSGKIYLKGNYVFINEPGKGIHLINNADKTAPVSEGFINIPGNFDMAAFGDIIYADSYIDLLAIDISDLNDIKVVKRVENAFPINYGYYDLNQPLIVEYVETEAVEVSDGDCRGGAFVNLFDNDVIGVRRDASAEVLSSAIGVGGPSAGIGGSLARFTISSGHLYAIDSYQLNVFSLADITCPDSVARIELEWGIETIFPYEDKLFIGAQNGMHIFDNSTPELPTRVSSFLHVRTCDPVVVENDIAYVTLHSSDASGCAGFTNQLDVIDISDITQPTLIKTYEMSSPRGLGIDNGTLFICEAEFGLKVFDATDVNVISDNLLAEFKDINALDVIPYNDNLLMIGEEGLYQYDYSDKENLTLLSIIPVGKN